MTDQLINNCFELVFKLASHGKDLEEIMHHRRHLLV